MVYFHQASNLLPYLNDDEGKLTLITEYETEYEDTGVLYLDRYTHTRVHMYDRKVPAGQSHEYCM